MWRRTLIISAVFFGVLAGTLLGLTSDRVADNLRQRLIITARDNYGLHISIDRLELSFLPLKVRIQNMRVRRPDEIRDWVRIHTGSIRVRPWPSTAGALVIDSLTLDGLYLDLRQIGDGQNKGQSTGKSKVDVRQVELWNSQVLLPTPEGFSNLRDIDFSMIPQSRGGRRVELSVGRGEVLVGNEVLDLEARIRGVFRGSVDRPREVELTEGGIELPRLSLRAEGKADLTTPVPSLDFRIGAEVDLEQLSNLPIDLPPLRGTAKPTLVLSGTALAPKARLELKGENVHLARAELGSVALDAIYESDRVVLESVEVRHPRGGRITGSGSVGVETLDVSATARLHGVRLEEVLAEAGLRDSWVRLDLNSDVRATGSLSPLDIQIELDGSVDRFQVLGSSYRNRDAREFLGLEQVPIAGRAVISDDRVSINSVRLGPAESRLELEGLLHYREGLDLRAESNVIDLNWIGPIADVPFAGRGSIAADINGPYSKPVVAAKLDMEDFGMLGYAFGKTQGALEYRGHRLQLEKVSVERDKGRVEGAGFLEFRDGVQLQITADIERVETSKALQDLKLPSSITTRVRGPASGRLELRGNALRPEGSVSVRSDAVSYHGIPLGTTTVDLGFGNETEKLWLKVGIIEQSGMLDARVGWIRDGTMSLKGQFANLPIDAFQRLLGNAPAKGTLNGRVNLTGPQDRLSGSASAQLRGLSVYGARFGVTRVRAQVDAGQATLKGSLLNGGIVANGSIRLSEKLPFNISASFNELEGGKVLDLGTNASSTLTGSLFAQGSILEPSKVVADARLDRWIVTLAEERLVAMRTVNLTWANGTLLIPDAAFRGPDLRLLLTGQVSTRTPMRLRVAGDGSLSALALVSSRVSRGSGDVEFNLGIEGTPGQPSLSGELTVSDGELLLSGQKKPATAINGRVTLRETAANIESTRFMYGGGPVSLAGQLVVSDFDNPEASIRADFDRVSLDPADDIDATVSGSLLLLGPLDDLRLRGNVIVDEIAYTRNVNLISIIPRRGSQPPLNVPAVEDSEAISLGVKITADETIRFSNNVLDASFSADLTLTGTSNRMGLLGTVTPARARARYAGNLYKLERGSIDFTEEYEIFSRFSLRATTKACGIDATVDVFGDSEAYNVSPSGSDDNGLVDPQEVLVCLQFGTRQRDFSGGGSPVTSSAVGGVDDELAAAVSGIDALWTVSGLDDRVREVLPIDEVRITNAWSPQANGIRPRLVLGKEIGEAVRLQYWQSIVNDDPEEAYQALSVQYQLSRKATLEGTWLTEYQTTVPVTDLGLDLRLRWELR